MTQLYYKLGIYSFTVGCICFTFDSIKVKPFNKCYFLGCILFDIGCGFFIADAHANE